MFFTCENLSVEIVDVLEFYHENTHNVGNRRFNSLSLRLSADTEIISGGTSRHISENTIGFFPSHRSYKRVSKNEHLISINFILYNQSFDELEFLKPKNAGELSRLFIGILEISRQKSCGYRYEQLKIFYEIMRFLYIETVSDTINPQDEDMNDIKKYIDSNFCEPSLSVADLARSVYMSEVTFRKKFHAAFGKPPKQYIIDKRIEYAISLLYSQNLKISEIAKLTGFTNEKYFSTLFRRRYSMPPSQYAKK